MKLEHNPVALHKLVCHNCGLEWLDRKRPKYHPGNAKQNTYYCPVCSNVVMKDWDGQETERLIVPYEPNIYHYYDKNWPERYRWPWVYLHGTIEERMDDIQQEHDFEWEAPDLFVADYPSPLGPGTYFCRMYGEEVVVNMAWRDGLLCGRAAMPGDGDFYKHIFQPEAWR